MSKDSPPPKIVQDLAVAYWASRCLHLVAEFGIADLLGDEPQTAETLARPGGLNPQALQRCVRDTNVCEMEDAGVGSGFFRKVRRG